MNIKSQSIILLLYTISLATYTHMGSIDKLFLTQFLPENPIIIEAGAHKGFDTIQMAELWPESTIYAFEPAPLLYRKLCNRTKSYPNIHCFSYALSDSNKQTHLNISTFGATGASSLLKPSRLFFKIYPSIIFNHRTLVRTINLDDWLKKQCINLVDFLWLDLQGAEPFVLQSCPQLLSKVRAIYTEVNYKPLYVEGILYNELKTFLHEQGFKEIYEIYPHGAKGNVLFIKNEIEKVVRYDAPITRAVYDEEEDWLEMEVENE